MKHIQVLLKAIYNLNEIDKSIMLLYLEEKSYDEICRNHWDFKIKCWSKNQQSKRIIKTKLKYFEIMENNELQKIWKNIDIEINQKSKDELNLLLTSKTRQTINKFLYYHWYCNPCRCWTFNFFDYYFTKSTR